MCGFQWDTRDDLLSDESLELNGYQADFEKLEYGLFFFTHYVDGCKSTLAIPASEFLDLNTEKKYTQQKTFSEDCPQYCVDIHELRRCEAQCECAFVRNIITIIKDRKTNPKAIA